ncbi:hypothetical protein [Lentilactobacillus hilgardii]|uniref:hypothetical protein n=1 Tax=Lentilactobacillus hilgardii TaxID=1588 RepID=UPI0039EA42B9
MIAGITMITVAFGVQANAQDGPKAVQSHTMPSSFIGSWHFYDQDHHQFEDMKITANSVQQGEHKVFGKNLIMQRIKLEDHYQYSFFDKRVKDGCFGLYHPARVLVNGHYYRSILLDRQMAYLPFKTKRHVVIPKVYRY